MKEKSEYSYKVGDIIIRSFGFMTDWMQGSSYLIVEIINEPDRLEFKCLNLRTGNFRYVGKEFLSNMWKRL